MTHSLSDTTRFALTMACRSAQGQVAAVVAFMERHGAYIQEFAVYDDQPTQRFFMRAVFRMGAQAEPGLQALRQEMEQVARRIGALEWAVHDLARAPRVLLMVSKLDHCLRDLLSSWAGGEMPMQPVAIVSNHPDLAPIASEYQLPFHHVPVDSQTKPQQEQRLLGLYRDYQADLVVLARYMQVLSNETCLQLAGRVINIHHSFLPGFKGAKPYHQAFERGVKLIGATAHFATPDLDEGPIIEQETERVDHAHSAEDLLHVGRRMECAVISRALRLVLEHRVFINGQRTVVLR